MGKSKMWNISKTPSLRAKRTKIWHSGYYSAYIAGTFDARFLGLGSFDALCKIFNLQFLKLAPLPIFTRYIQNFIQLRHHNRTGCHFLAICQNLQNYGILNLLNTGPMQLGFSKVLFLPQHWLPL